MMRAVVLNSSGVKFESEYPAPEPGDGEVLVRVTCAGVCETDLQLIAGYMDYSGVLGHEFVGVAESGELAGQRVVGEINCACQKCEYCRRGLQRHCPHRTVVGILNHDGAFADYVVIPRENLHVVPDDMPDEIAVFTEPVAAAFEIPEQVRLDPSLNVIVLGDGRLGNLCAQVIRQAGCSPTVIGKHDAKLKLLDDLDIQTARLSDWDSTQVADVVVDCTGSPTGFEFAVSLVKPRGTIMLKTTVAGTQQLSLAPLVIDEITLVGSRCGPFDKALAALSAGTIDVAPLISRRYPLADAVTALYAARDEPVLKLLLDVRTT
jgi:threonine dehydrogenase-like Zn-dependent dehydrogenase